MPIVAWYMLSKESYINRVIRDVLPTVYSNQHLQNSSIDAAYRFARQGRLICLTVSKLSRAYEVQFNADLNFFNGLLYDPPACAILSLLLWWTHVKSRERADLQKETIKYAQRTCGVSGGY